ncbi:MAG: hypothetical protein HYT64_02655 [Candidatus Yanofskybacteria bacterium]|nr:hypothetical protein [Candidatus Yanofskybacteria bacterium]
MESDHILFFGLAVFTLLLYVGLFFPQLRILVKWLKGSRKTYYLGSRDISPLRSTNTTLEELTRIADPGVITESMIEISRGPFRRRSAIYGSAAKNWKLVGSWLDHEGGGVVELQDTFGITLGNVLRLINTYPSLQAMLNENDSQKKRIAELEKELSETRESFSNLHADVEAVIKVVKNDKQKYRAPAAQRIQHCLEEICLHSKAPKPDLAIVDYCAACFKGRFKLL